MRRRPFSNSRARNANAALALAAALGSGCSFLFSEGPPARHRELGSFQCGESYAPPIVDTVAAGAFAALAAGAAQAEDGTVAAANPIDRPQVRRDTNVAIGLFAAVAIVDTASAIYGYSTVPTCRAAQRARREEIARVRLLQPPYGTPPYGEPPPLWPPPAITPSR